MIGLDTAACTDFTLSSSACRGFAIPIREALAIAAKISNGESSAGVHVGPSASLGVELAIGKGALGGAGARVSAVLAGSPAQLAGLAAGDLITSLAGHRVTSASGLTSSLDRCQPTEQVSVGWVDSVGQAHAASVQLAIGPPA